MFDDSKMELKKKVLDEIMEAMNEREAGKLKPQVEATAPVETESSEEMEIPKPEVASENESSSGLSSEDLQKLLELYSKVK